MARRQLRAATPRASPHRPPASAARPKWIAWLAPNLPLTVALAAAVYCVQVYQAPSRFFSDADPGWHIRAGDWILAHRSVPVADPFSFLQTGHGWFAWEWLAEMIMALAHRTLGLTGVVWLYVLILSAATWVWFHLHWKVGGNFLLACLMAIPLLGATQIHWLARPHVFSFLFLPATLWAIECLPERFRWTHGLAAFAGGALSASRFRCYTEPPRWSRIANARAGTFW